MLPPSRWSSHEGDRAAADGDGAAAAETEAELSLLDKAAAPSTVVPTSNDSVRGAAVADAPAGEVSLVHGDRAFQLHPVAQVPPARLDFVEDEEAVTGRNYLNATT